MQMNTRLAIWLSVALLITLIGLNSLTLKPALNEEETTSPREECSVQPAADPSAFLSVWDTTRTSGGYTESSASNQIKLPLTSDGTYNYTVNWGDGSENTIMVWNQTEVTHTYTAAGLYIITITGIIIGWQFKFGGDRLKILEIQQWGALRLGNASYYFYGCENLQLTTTDALNLTGTTNLNFAFHGCRNLGSDGNLNAWDVSGVTKMNLMFSGASSFNQPLDKWNVSGVTTMGSMFFGAPSFNQPLGIWDVSNVKYMEGMFQVASNFNQPLDTWNVSSVLLMNSMFYGASSFNQPLGTWNVSNVVGMREMFQVASSFNQPLGTWNVSKVITMEAMFAGVSLSTENYDNLLLSWAQLPLQQGVYFDGGCSKYSSDAETARQSIIDTYGWSITDCGLERAEPPFWTSVNFWYGLAALGIAAVVVVGAWYHKIKSRKSAR